MTRSLRVIIASVGLLLLVVSHPWFVVPVRAAVGFVSAVSVAYAADDTTEDTGQIDTRGATLLIAAQCYNQAGSPNAPTDGQSNAWTPLTESVGNSVARLYYVANPTVNEFHTFTQSSGSGTVMATHFGAFSGVVTTSPFDQENGADTSSATTLQPGSVTPSEDNELVITNLSGQFTAGVSLTIDGTYTLQAQYMYTETGFEQQCGWAWDIQTTATATNPTWTQSATHDHFSSRIATFKEAAAGGPPVGPRLLMLGVAH